MSDDPSQDWVIPASIPFDELKAKDLEECVYWLLDAMGAKDLEWRVGGAGGGAADGGRDLEARFSTPGEGDEIRQEKWWVECKGRTGTVDPSEVKSAVNNVLAYGDVDHMVIATNTQFSNPTRDWVKEWQKTHPRPKVQLWDHSHLERYLSRYPDVVLRLFSEALSLQGRYQAMEARFWNKLEFVSLQALCDLWKDRKTLDVTALGIFALIANEFAHGNITHRPWGATLDGQQALDALHMSLLNAPYLMIRVHRVGVEETILTRTFAYLILVLLEHVPPEGAAEIIDVSLNRGSEEKLPDFVQEALLLPILDQLLLEMQDLCGSDCRRMMMTDRYTLMEGRDEAKDYWLRLEAAGVEEKPETRRIVVESYREPCIVGFDVGENVSCPLFALHPSLENVSELMAVVKRVAAFRKNQAANARDEEKQKEREHEKRRRSTKK